jgi:hypothetical protein
MYKNLCASLQKRSVPFRCEIKPKCPPHNAHRFMWSSPLTKVVKDYGNMPFHFANDSQRQADCQALSLGERFEWSALSRTPPWPAQCPLLAQSGHSTTEFQCPLLGVKQTLGDLPYRGISYTQIIFRTWLGSRKFPRNLVRNKCR